MPPKRKITANVDKEPKSKKLKLMTDPTPRKQKKLEFEVKGTAPLTERQVQEIFHFTPDRLYWYRTLDVMDPRVRNDGKWYMQPGYVYHTVGSGLAKVVTSDRPCPQLPKDMWGEILKKVVFLTCFELEEQNDWNNIFGDSPERIRVINEYHATIYCLRSTASVCKVYIPHEEFEQIRTDAFMTMMILNKLFL